MGLISLRIRAFLEVREHADRFAKGLAHGLAPALPATMNLRREEVKVQWPPREAGHPQQQVQIRKDRLDVMRRAPRATAPLSLRRLRDP